ncbi:hypothetical protein [Nocardia stercoris]|uniref:GRAM domain-containing protein n=1 Tax=Nocardia stercoris TaxID=2483361 RepID=A0A3M2L1V8_9NOCA|nr:hypothetical protein [Nocardia stercoris]RMI31374.1 hypothetical protein EBN03_18645 [Nocardia stercoris]
MGIWIRSPKLADGETVSWRRFANRTQGNRAVGGRLYLTGARVLFEPSHVDALTGGQSWSAPLEWVASVGSQLPTGGAFDGGLRTRLRIQLRDGTVELFVVNGLDDAIAVLQRAAGHAVGPARSE